MEKESMEEESVEKERKNHKKSKRKDRIGGAWQSRNTGEENNNGEFSKRDHFIPACDRTQVMRPVPFSFHWFPPFDVFHCMALCGIHCKAFIVWHESWYLCWDIDLQGRGHLRCVETDILSVAPWSGSTKNTDISTGPLACPFARSLAPLTHLLALHYLLRTRALLRLLALFAHSLARGKVNDWMAI